MAEMRSTYMPRVGEVSDEHIVATQILSVRMFKAGSLLNLVHNYLILHDSLMLIALDYLTCGCHWSA